MKKTWGIGLGAILLTILAVIFAANLQKKVILNEAKVNLINLAGSVEMDLDRAFFGLNQLFLGLRNYLEAASVNGPADDPAVRRIIDNLLRENRFLTAIMVIDADGQVLHWNNNYQKPNLSERDYFKAFQNGYPGDFFIGTPQESIINKGQWIFGVSRAFRDDNGKRTKVISAIIDTNTLYRRYQSMFDRAHAKLSIFSADGDIYVRIPDHQSYVGKRDPSLASQRPLTTNAEIIQDHAEPGGDRYLSIIQGFDRYPLFFSVTKSEDEVFAQWHDGLTSYYLLGAAICFALLLLTYRADQSQKQQLEATRKLQLQATSDPLTGLHNRRHILDQAMLELKKAQRLNTSLSLIMLDLDDFKQVNDNCGHDIGDRVLEETASLLKKICRDTDLISRYGGEEFLLILPGTGLSGATHIAEKIRRAMEARRFEGTKGEFMVTGSFGVGQFKEDEELASGIKRADDALYQAKGKGRNHVVKALNEDLGNKLKNELFWISKRS